MRVPGFCIRKIACGFALACGVLMGNASTRSAHAGDAIAGDAIADVGSFGESEVLYVRRIAPLFRERCLGCHGGDPDAIEGSLNLRDADNLRSGGDSAEPSIVPGNAEASPVYLSALRDHDDWSAMPPKDAEALDDEQLRSLRRWIDTGAAIPDDARITTIETQYAKRWNAEDGIRMSTSGGLSDDWTNRRYDPSGLWAYQPLDVDSLDKRLPGFANRPRRTVDNLIADAMPEGLTPAPAADRATLLRRLSFDLTGLPPTPTSVDRFVTDPRPDAIVVAEVVDRMLASPDYGHRMAQHWLDVVRYADSSGFANDYERGAAWRYRDYVVRSFNGDKPYDQFILEQIAGDELNFDTAEQTRDAILATGFLRMGPWELTGMEVAKVARQRFLDDVTNAVGETFLGHALQCARCHDHKFDPVPTRDYYGIQAVFASTQLADRRCEYLPDENTDNFDEQRFLHRKKRFYEATLSQLESVLLENSLRWFDDHPEHADNRQRWENELAKSKGKSRGTFSRLRDAMKRAGLDENTYPPKKVYLTPEQFGLERIARKGLERLQWMMDRYKPVSVAVYNGYTPTMTRVHTPLRMPDDRFLGTLEKTAILTGGDPFSPDTVVPPSGLSVVADQVPYDIPAGMDGRRTALAMWIADPRNPLTPRVMANRVWQWHFGRGLAANPNNFGSTGAPPTHPELLDHLAAELIRGGWSIKRLHRIIVTSDTYRRSSRHPDPDRLAELDPTGTSYAAFNPRRLTAEELRDATLMISGELNAAVGGIPVRPEINPEVAHQPRMVMGTFAEAWAANPRPADRHRRSIYTLRLRGLPQPMMEVFNAPGPDFSCERRDASTITPQVFALFNGGDPYRRAVAIADRLWRDVGDPNAETPGEVPDAVYADVVRRLTQLSWSRQPTDAETRLMVRHIRQTADRNEPPVQSDVPPREVLRDAVEENTGERFEFTEPLYSNEEFEPDLTASQLPSPAKPIVDLAIVMINSNEFVYVE